MFLMANHKMSFKTPKMFYTIPHVVLMFAEEVPINRRDAIMLLAFLKPAQSY